MPCVDQSGQTLHAPVSNKSVQTKSMNEESDANCSKDAVVYALHAEVHQLKKRVKELVYMLESVYLIFVYIYKRIKIKFVYIIQCQSVRI